MANGFDTAAAGYDQSFTHTVIGRLQRQYVREHLTKILEKTQPKNILEINCGTGEDAIWISEQQYKITATDLSKAMIEVAKSKSSATNLTFKTLDINTLSKHFNAEKFDLIFSNFGGLNCLSKIQLELFYKNAAELLTDKGKLVLVVMPKNTLWENFYFLSKAKFNQINRRKKDSLIANVDGEQVITYYYNPKKMARLADYYFRFESTNPIGFFVPPSYLEPFFSNKPKLVSILDQLESKVKNHQTFSRFADHYLIVFEKR